MKRKRSPTLFFWGATRDPPKEFASVSEGPQIQLILKPATSYRNSMPMPYELLVKIFAYVIETSDDPMRDLYHLARVCEEWRNIILGTPSLWTRIDLSQLPVTDRNLSVLSDILKKNPAITDHIKEFSLAGVVEYKTCKSSTFIETIIKAPNLSTLTFQEVKPGPRTTALIHKTIGCCKKLKSLTVAQSRLLFTSQRWLTDYLTENGRQLEVLNIGMSLNTIPPTLIRVIASEFCQNLRFLDISTFDALNTHSFDALQFEQNMPSLEVLRVANVSFKRVFSPPTIHTMTQMRELSMPIAIRDADRDDALLATLAFGSDTMTCLDLRGSSISALALMQMPSYHVRELHIDDLCPPMRAHYRKFIKKWAHSLEILSLVKINCSETIKCCLEALYEDKQRPKVKDLDLSGSDVTREDLTKFLKVAKMLNRINLSACRSLPRGCKGQYSKKPTDQSSQPLKLLFKKLK